MRCSNMGMGPAENAGARGRGRASIASDIIWRERAWRVKPGEVAQSAPRVVATRWFGLEAGAREVSAETPPDCHIVKIILRNMNCRFAVAGRIVHDGQAGPGMVHVTEPGADSRGLFRGPYEHACICACTRTA